MSATDELRRMLDERGVEWTAVSKDVTMDNQTYCYPHTFTEFQDGLMVSNLTPEQAIDATLGAGTCRNVDADPGWFSCSKCGCICSVDWYGSGFGTPNSCPNCGRKVEKG